MIKAVLDTNVIVSSQLSAQGAAALIFDFAMSRHFRCFVSAPLLEEYSEVSRRPKFGLDEWKTASMLRRFRKIVILVRPRQKLQITLDPDDNKVMECALEARADFVVTGNIRHFPARFQDIRILAPRQFLTVLASSPT